MVKQFSDINTSHLPYYQHRAIMRLQLMANSLVHQRISKYLSSLRPIIERQTDAQGKLASNDFVPIESFAMRNWRIAFDDMMRYFDNARQQASRIALATLVRGHEKFIVQTDVTESMTPLQESEAIDLEWDRIRKEVNGRYYNNKVLSDRIWDLGNDSQVRISNLIRSLIVDGAETWQVMESLESELGANQDCPRWTYTRLYQLTPKQRGVTKQGLLSGNPCGSSGIAYNVIRLIRNEIQVIYQAAVDKVLKSSPWVKEEQIILSPLHPRIGCVCEDVVAGGRDGMGIYPVGTHILPLHIQCMCLKIGVTVSEKEFTKRMSDWINFRQSDSGLDKYGQFIGADRSNIKGVNLAGLSGVFLFWLLSSPDQLSSSLQ